MQAIKLPYIIIIAILLYVLIIAGTYSVLLVLIGAGLGLAFIAASIGFTTAWRRFIVLKDPSGMYVQFALLLFGMYLCIPFLASFDSLSPAAAPVSFSLVLGAFAFGFFMQLSDGCGSGILASTASGKHIILVLIAFAIGAFLGTLHLPWWLSLGSLGSFVLYQEFDLVSSLLLQTILIAILLGLVYIKTRSTAKNTWKYKGCKPYIIVFFIALLSLLILLLSAVPWGIVYGLGLWVAKVLVSLGVNLEHISFWASHKQALESSILLDNTSLTNIGFILGAWALSQLVRIKTNTKIKQNLFSKKVLINILAAIAAGYFSRVAFGCNIGAFYSGIISTSVSAWVWFLCAFLGTMIAVKLRPLCGMDNQ